MSDREPTPQSTPFHEETSPTVAPTPSARTGPRKMAAEPFFYIVYILVAEVVLLQFALPYISKWFPG